MMFFFQNQAMVPVTQSKYMTKLKSIKKSLNVLCASVKADL